MTLEQRVKALEEKLKDLSLKGVFTIENGRVYINETTITNGKINAAETLAALQGN